LRIFFASQHRPEIGQPFSKPGGVEPVKSLLARQVGVVFDPARQLA
jgi:hypothetical protein